MPSGKGVGRGLESYREEKYKVKENTGMEKKRTENIEAQRISKRKCRRNWTKLW
eukprot:SAG11_NODE_4733_length_1787_cov_2.133294_1_plen_54_part_00